jgi:predicted dehydrogenase
MALKLAFAGTGSISKTHARAAQSLPDVELEAVVNHKSESMGQFAATYHIARQYTELYALLKAGGVDAIVVSTPNYLHASQTIAALNAGIHVMVEKPMAMNAAEAEAMLEASQQSGALLMVAHCWRFDAEVLWLKQHVGQLGKIIRTKGYGVHSHWGPDGWFAQAQYAGGGSIADMGIHAIDTARFLLGDPKPVSVYARIGTYYTQGDVDDTGIMMVNWDNGAVSYIESGWWQPHSDGVEAATQLYGLSGFGELFPAKIAVPNADKTKIETIDGGFASPRDPHCPQSMYDAQLAYFVDCIRNNRIPVPGALEGLANMQVIDAAYASARSGQVVQIG